MNSSLLPLPSPSCEIFSHQVFSPGEETSFPSVTFSDARLRPGGAILQKVVALAAPPEPSSSQVSVYAATNVFKSRVWRRLCRRTCSSE